MTRPYMPRMAAHARSGYAQENLCVPLTGVAQIPDDVARTITQCGDFHVTPEQAKRAEDVIWKDATKEIQRRHQARKAGIRIEEFYPYTPEQVRAQTLQAAGRYEFADDE